MNKRQNFLLSCKSKHYVDRPDSRYKSIQREVVFVEHA